MFNWLSIVTVHKLVKSLFMKTIVHELIESLFMKNNLRMGVV